MPLVPPLPRTAVDSSVSPPVSSFCFSNRASRIPIFLSTSTASVSTVAAGGGGGVTITGVVLANRPPTRGTAPRLPLPEPFFAIYCCPCRLARSFSSFKNCINKFMYTSRSQGSRFSISDREYLWCCISEKLVL